MPNKLSISEKINNLKKAAILPKDKLKRKPDNRFFHLKKLSYSKLNNQRDENVEGPITANEKIDQTVNNAASKGAKAVGKASAKLAMKLLKMALRYIVTVIIPLLFSTVGLIGIAALIVIIVVYSVMKHFSFFTGSDEADQNPGVKIVEKYDNLNRDINNVVEKYNNRYQIKIDKYLILATLVADKNPNFSLDESVKLKKDEFDDNKSYVKKIEELASYQIVKDKICPDPRARNCPNAIYSYRVSIRRGNVKDKSSGSAFYWNLINGNFLNNYYANLFENKTKEEQIIKKVELVDFIYDYANGLRDLSENKLKE